MYARVTMRCPSAVFSFLFIFTLFSILFTQTTLAQTPQQNNISVSATVPPTTSDYQFAFTANHGQRIASDTTVRFTITYGASTSAGLNTPITLRADWSRDTGTDGTHLYDYVVGAASKAYGNVSPVVDTTNRTITWTLPSLPAGTMDQEVNFELRTNYHYQTQDSGITVTATMSNQYVTLPTQEIHKTYYYNERTADPTPTPTPTGPVPTTAITPLQQLTINDVTITGISDSSSTIRVITSIPTKLSLKYGDTSGKLLQSISSVSISKVHDLQIDNLQPFTAYYFQITASDATQTATSEIFTFRTAEPSETPSLEKNVIVVTSGEIVLVSDVRELAAPPPLVLITSNTNYQLTYRLKQKVSVKQIEAVIRSKTLGFSTFAQTQEPFTLIVPMVLKEPSVYVATLKTLEPGSYEVYTRITDTKGNVVEQKLADIKTISQLSIYEEATAAPIPEARVFLLYYDEKTRSYLPLVKEIFGIAKNPLYTNTEGELNVVLPRGKYKAEIQAFGFDRKTVEFVLGTGEDEIFPRIYLTRNEASIASTIEYYSTYLYDTYRNLPSLIQSISLSVKFFNVIAFLITTIFVGLTLLMFILYTHIRLRDIPGYLKHHLHHMTNRNQNLYLTGAVTDESHEPLTQARIEVLDKTTHTILSHAVTNKTGRFFIKNTFGESKIELLISKDGFTPTSVSIENNKFNNPVQTILQKGGANHHTAGTLLSETATLSSSLLFEFFLVSSFILEFFFFQLYGFSKTIPFFLLSLTNLLLWTLFLRERFEVDLRHLKITSVEEKITL